MGGTGNRFASTTIAVSGVAALAAALMSTVYVSFLVPAYGYWLIRTP